MGERHSHYHSHYHAAATCACGHIQRPDPAHVASGAHVAPQVAPLVQSKTFPPPLCRLNAGGVNMRTVWGWSTPHEFIGSVEPVDMDVDPQPDQPDQPGRTDMWRGAAVEPPPEFIRVYSDGGTCGVGYAMPGPVTCGDHGGRCLDGTPCGQTHWLNSSGRCRHH